MQLTLGSTFPNVDLVTTTGKFKLYDYQGDSWLVFFSHPADYTPVCTTELARAADLATSEFAKRNAKLLALSCDTIEDHIGWSKDIMSCCKNKSDKDLPYPIVDDHSRDLAKRFGMLDETIKDKAGHPLTCRAVFIIDPHKKLRLLILYPASVGRNFDEIVRVLDSLQLHETKRVVTPADWKVGDKVLVPPSLGNENFPKGVETVSLPSKRDYLRYTKVED